MGQALGEDALAEGGNGGEGVVADWYIFIALPMLQPQGEAHRRYALHAAFEDSTHGAAVVNADAGIVAMVDAAEDEVGLARHNLLHRQLHTIHRGAAAGEESHGSGITRRAVHGSHGKAIGEGGR